MTAEPHDFQDIRDEVRSSAPSFPASTGASSIARRAYPDEFVTALTAAGYLAALIPEEYGGAGLALPPRRPSSWKRSTAAAQRRGVPRADVHDGHAPAPRVGGAEAPVPAADRGRARFDCRRLA